MEGFTTENKVKPKDGIHNKSFVTKYPQIYGLMDLWINLYINGFIKSC